MCTHSQRHMQGFANLRTELMPVNCWKSGIMTACTAKRAVRFTCAAAEVKPHYKSCNNQMYVCIDTAITSG